MNLYYDLKHPSGYKRADWFRVVGVSRLYEERDMRLNYVVWQEGVNPLVVVELLSPGTENEDSGKKVGNLRKPATKWEVYEQIRVPYYVTFSRYTNEMQGFHLVGGRYQTAELTDGRLLIPSIELSLGLWQGSDSNIERLWLRWMSMDGDLIPISEEEVVAAQQQAINAEERADRLNVGTNSMVEEGLKSPFRSGMLRKRTHLLLTADC
ncbi:Uma2 family endonuclease [Okeania sp. SIO2C2]|uniref:Uma2 family endonuclease n=1 Tax=Okeania sp. SIO2C2 TaxID=2607787 RepID=UPI00338F59E2